MRFDIYGRFELDVRWEHGQWVAYRSAMGLRRKETAVNFPAGIEESELACFLDDVFHELAGPGQTIRMLK
ncbi:hypothetical protein HPT27_14560 [Permianibacter sp. IMCC34836]|uniref:DUF7661 family protein n=1 Tax=Permianibacter fluminis TaxID=2738515 RepID=UPI00155704F0|nr:hypothetical protein [Permianibacter fluminis]NQD38247.1 hypothetical protein [Permianibacter fluminis]